MSKNRALKLSGVSVVENIVGFVVVFFTENTQFNMAEAHLKLSSPQLSCAEDDRSLRFSTKILAELSP